MEETSVVFKKGTDSERMSYPAGVPLPRVGDLVLCPFDGRLTKINIAPSAPDDDGAVTISLD